MRAVIYCRVSTADQVQNLSLSTQEEACRAYCAKVGYIVDRVFVDPGESAKTTQRPAFLQLLGYTRANKGRVRAVVVYALTRFSRNTTDHHAIAALLRGQGIVLRSVTEAIDESPQGKLMESILAGFAQFDNDVKSERTRAGMKAAASRGRWMWFAPIGYLNSSDRLKPSLIPDPDTAGAVRLVFASAAGGVTGRELLAVAHAQGLRSRHGHRLASSQLHAMLRNPVYTGVLRSVNLGIDTQGDFEAIVDEPLFAQVQARLTKPMTTAQRSRGRFVDHPDFPLRRFIRCGVCERPMTGSWSTGRGGKRYAHYHCVRGCNRVARETLHETFLTLLDALRPTEAAWRWLSIKILELWRGHHADAAREEGARRAAVGRLQQELERVDHLFIERAVIDEATYLRERERIRERLLLAKMQLSEAQITETELEGLVTFADYALRHASALWSMATSVEQQIRVQWTMFPTGVRWNGAAFLEPLNCLQHYQLAGSTEGTSDWLPDRPLTWHHISAFLRHFAVLRAA